MLLLLSFYRHLVGLQHKAKQHPTELSGGERQRVGLARALVNNPSIIIADEPTGNIDPALSFEIVDLLSEINRRGTTILMVTHEHSLVKHFHKRIIQIHSGQIVADTAAALEAAEAEEVYEEEVNEDITTVPNEEIAEDITSEDLISDDYDIEDADSEEFEAEYDEAPSVDSIEIEDSGFEDIESGDDTFEELAGDLADEDDSIEDFVNDDDDIHDSLFSEDSEILTVDDDSEFDFNLEDLNLDDIEIDENYEIGSDSISDDEE